MDIIYTKEYINIIFMLEIKGDHKMCNENIRRVYIYHG